MARARIALFVLEALPNARTVRRFVADHVADIAFVGLSNPRRPSTGGFLGQVSRHLRHSGSGFMLYLTVNSGLPDLLRPLAPLTQDWVGTRDSPDATPLKTLCERLHVPTLKVDDVNGVEVARTLSVHRTASA